MSLRDDQMLVMLRLAGVESLKPWLSWRTHVVDMLREAIRYRGRRYSPRRGDGLLYHATEGPRPLELISTIRRFAEATDALLRELRAAEHAHVGRAILRRMALKAKRSYAAVIRTYARLASRPPPNLAKPRWLMPRDPLHAVWRPRLTAPSAPLQSPISVAGAAVSAD